MGTILTDRFARDADRLNEALKERLKEYKNLHLYNIIDYHVEYMRYRAFITNLGSQEAANYLAQKGFEALREPGVREDIRIYELYSTEFFAVECVYWDKNSKFHKRRRSIKDDKAAAFYSFNDQTQDRLDIAVDALMEFIDKHENNK